MIFMNNSRMPYWLLFVIYLTCNCILWVMFTACIGTLVDLIDFLKGDFQRPLSISIITWPFIYVAALPMYVIFIYYKMANNVKQVEINAERRSVTIWYLTLLFKKKQRTFFVDDEEFEYAYARNSELKPLQKMRAFTYGTSIAFFHKGRCRCRIIIRETAGWPHQQLESMITVLEELKPPMEFSID